MVSDMLEAMEGRRRGPIGGEENAGKPSADTSGGDGGSVSEDIATWNTRSKIMDPILGQPEGAQVPSLFFWK